MKNKLNFSSPSNAIFHSRRNKQQQKILFNNSFLLLFSWGGEGARMLMHMCPLYTFPPSIFIMMNDNARQMHLGKWDGKEFFSIHRSSFYCAIVERLNGDGELRLWKKEDGNFCREFFLKLEFITEFKNFAFGSRFLNFYFSFLKFTRYNCAKYLNWIQTL